MADENCTVQPSYNLQPSTAIFGAWASQVSMQRKVLRPLPRTCRGAARDLAMVHASVSHEARAEVPLSSGYDNTVENSLYIVLYCIVLCIVYNLRDRYRKAAVALGRSHLSGCSPRSIEDCALPSMSSLHVTNEKRSVTAGLVMLDFGSVDGWRTRSGVVVQSDWGGPATRSARHSASSARA